jgi:hypothetical protein
MKVKDEIEVINTESIPADSPFFSKDADGDWHVCLPAVNKFYEIKKAWYADYLQKWKVMVDKLNGNYKLGLTSNPTGDNTPTPASPGGLNVQEGLRRYPSLPHRG